MSRVFTNDPGDRSSIPGRVIPNTQKMVLDTALLNNQPNTVRMKSKLYNQVQQTAWVSQFQLELESVGDRMPAEWEPAPEKGLGPSVTHGWAAQPGCERSAAMVRRTLGQYVTVCPRLQHTSHTQPISNLSRIKNERYIFMKKRVRPFIEVRHNSYLPNPSTRAGYDARSIFKRSLMGFNSEFSFS